MTNQKITATRLQDLPAFQKNEQIRREHYASTTPQERRERLLKHLATLAQQTR